MAFSILPAQLHKIRDSTGTAGPHLKFTSLVIADIWAGKVIDMLETNTKSELLDYLDPRGGGQRMAAEDVLTEREREMDAEELEEKYSAEMKLAEEEGIQAVVIDMTSHYREAINEKLPGAKVVVDRFHIVQRANLALGRIRIDESRKMGLEAEWRDERSKLAKLSEQLGDGEKFRLEAALEPMPRLKKAYEVRNEFRKIFELDSRTEAAKALREWVDGLPESIEEEFERVTVPLSNWWDEILNYFDAQYTNASVEGLNRAIKQIRTEGVGYSFDTLRAKVIYGMEIRRETRNTPAVSYERIALEGTQSSDPAREQKGEFARRFEEHFGQRPEDFDPTNHVFEGVPFDRIAENLELW
jgi:hypothetical protein